MTSRDGATRFERQPAWSETDLFQEIARWPGGVAWYTVEPDVLDERVRDRTVREMIEAAREAGAPVREEDGRISVLVRAAVTHTIGGLRIDERARVLDERGEPLDALFAAGVDAGGWSTGGYASGLSAALVFGRIAAESVMA